MSNNTQLNVDLLPHPTDLSVPIVNRPVWRKALRPGKSSEYSGTRVSLPIGLLFDNHLWFLPRIVCVLCILIALYLLTSFPASAHTLEGGNGSISGQLLDGSKHNAPLAQQVVTLQMAQGANTSDLTTATTDEHGTFTFSNLATDKTINYAVYIRYQGAQYLSDLVALDSNPAQHVNLTVYEATNNSEKIVITGVSVLIHKPDVQKGTISISEVFAFKNLDTRTYVGSLDASKGKPNALLFAVPRGAENITLSKGFDGYKLAAVGTGFATDAALPPGDSEFSFFFEVPYSASTYDFPYVPLYPTVSLTFLVPPELNAHSAVLNAQGETTSEDGQVYRVFKANLLKANQDLHLSLEGLPSSSAPVASSQLNMGAVWLTVALLLMLAIICVTWFLLRARRHTAMKKQVQRAKRGATKSKTVSAVKTGVSSPKEQHEELLQELLNLDKAFEAGKVSKADYQERRSKIKARLRTLIREKEATTR